MSYNIAIVGSRNFTDKELFDKVMSDILLIEGKPNKVISGGAIGSDTLAFDWAMKNKFEFVICEPKYKDFPKKSRNWMAPKERNTRIVENSDIVLAFWDMSSTGTLDTIEKAIENNRKIYIFNLLDYSLITENIV
jgi:hypothetical protein